MMNPVTGIVQFTVLGIYRLEEAHEWQNHHGRLEIQMINLVLNENVIKINISARNTD